MFTLLHPTESFVSFTSIDGSKHEVWPESGEQFYEGNLLPNGNFFFFPFFFTLIFHFHHSENFKLFYYDKGMKLGGKKLGTQEDELGPTLSLCLAFKIWWCIDFFLFLEPSNKLPN